MNRYEQIAYLSTLIPCSPIDANLQLTFKLSAWLELQQLFQSLCFGLLGLPNTLGGPFGPLQEHIKRTLLSCEWTRDLVNVWIVADRPQNLLKRKSGQLLEYHDKGCKADEK